MHTPHPPLAMQLYSLVDVFVDILIIAANLYIIVDIYPMHFWRMSFGTNSTSYSSDSRLYLCFASIFFSM